MSYHVRRYNNMARQTELDDVKSEFSRVIVQEPHQAQVTRYHAIAPEPGVQSIRGPSHIFGSGAVAAWPGVSRRLALTSRPGFCCVS